MALARSLHKKKYETAETNQVRELTEIGAEERSNEHYLHTSNNYPYWICDQDICTPAYKSKHMQPLSVTKVSTGKDHDDISLTCRKRLSLEIVCD